MVRMSRLRRRRAVGYTQPNGLNVGAKSVDVGGIRLASCANGEIDRWLLAEHGQELESHELAQSPLETIAVDGRVLVTRHHDAHSRKFERGSDDPHIEMYGPDSLPLSNDGLYVGAPRQPAATRKGKSVVMRLRTCSEAER
jgi:hypothetical protein